LHAQSLKSGSIDVPIRCRQSVCRWPNSYSERI
jgi:hypothetical protein